MAVKQADFEVDGLRPFIVVPEANIYSNSTNVIGQIERRYITSRRYVFNVINFIGIRYLSDKKSKVPGRKLWIDESIPNAEPWFLISGWEGGQARGFSRPSIVARLHEDSIIFLPIRRGGTSYELKTPDTAVNFSYMDASDVQMIRAAIMHHLTLVSQSLVGAAQ